MYELIDSYPTKPTRAEKIGSCEICGEGIFSDEEMWQSEKGNLYYCNKCVEESSRKRFKRQEEIREAIKKYKEYIQQKIKSQLEVNQYV